MQVTLADGSLIKSTQIYHVPLLCCSLAGLALFLCVPCHVLPQLNHDVVLGVDWLQSVNPTIDWQACTMAVQCVGQ